MKNKKQYSFLPNKAFDKNGVEITHLCQVEVPEPNDTDIHNFSFVGTADDYLEETNTIIVEDGDGDFFEIEANRLLVIQDDAEQKLVDSMNDEQIAVLQRAVANHFDTPNQ